MFIFYYLVLVAKYEVLKLTLPLIISYPQLHVQTLLVQVHTQLVSVLVLVLVLVLVELELIVSSSLLVLVCVLVLVWVCVTVGVFVFVSDMVTFVVGDPILEKVVVMGLL